MSDFICRVVAFSWLLLFFPFDGRPQAGGDLPRGEIVDRVACRLDSGQTYALYLPSGYTQEEQWPILYALDAGARGRLPVERFREAAEEYGFILAGSHNSRNGPARIIQDAVNALLVDTQTRFSVNPRRIYVAGFSGGARAAVQIGMAMKGKVAGILAFGAGFPPDMPPALPIPFSIYLAAGDEDFNFPELRKLEEALARLQVPHEFETFSGNHDWPPEGVCTHALEWLELQGMKSGIRDRDPSLVERIYAKTLREAELAEKEQRLPQSLERYAFALDSFAGLRDVTGLEPRIQQLNRSSKVRRSRSMEKEVAERQEALERELAGLYQDLSAIESRLLAAQRLHAALDRLRNDAGQKKNETRRLAANRSLTHFWILLSEGASAALERQDPAPAALNLELMTSIRPQNAQLYYHLARAYCLSGRKREALESLRRAVDKGFRDISILEGNPDFESLRGTPEYRKIVEELARR